VNALARSHEAAQHRGRPTAEITSEKHPIAATHSHHAFILPISGTKLKFTIVGTRFTADDCGCSTVNSALAAGSSMSKWRPAP
jgi:hypothetical protein